MSDQPLLDTLADMTTASPECVDPHRSWLMLVRLGAAGAIFNALGNTIAAIEDDDADDSAGPQIDSRDPCPHPGHRGLGRGGYSGPVGNPANGLV
jgi:hypothetical protein